jgi:hypothetical protein
LWGESDSIIFAGLFGKTIFEQEWGFICAGSIYEQYPSNLLFSRNETIYGGRSGHFAAPFLISSSTWRGIFTEKICPVFFF